MGQFSFFISEMVLTQDQRAALGSVVAESAYLEALTESILLDITNLKKPQLDAFLGRAMLQAKLDLLSEIGGQKIRSKKRAAAFSKIMSNLKANNSERTMAVHGVWSPKQKNPNGKDLGSILEIEHGLAQARHPRGHTLSAVKLAELALKISNGYWELFDFNMATWVKPYAKRRAKQRKKSA